MTPPLTRHPRNVGGAPHVGVTAAPSWNCVTLAGTLTVNRRVVVPGGRRGITNESTCPFAVVKRDGTWLQSGSPPDWGGGLSVKSSPSVPDTGTPVIHTGTARASTLPGFSSTRSNAVGYEARIGSGPSSANWICGAASDWIVNLPDKAAVWASGCVTITSHAPVAARVRSMLAVRLAPSVATVVATGPMVLDGLPSRRVSVVPTTRLRPAMESVTTPWLPPLDGFTAEISGAA